MIDLEKYMNFEQEALKFGLCEIESHFDEIKECKTDDGLEQIYDYMCESLDDSIWDERGEYYTYFIYTDKKVEEYAGYAKETWGDFVENFIEDVHTYTKDYIDEYTEDENYKKYGIHSKYIGGMMIMLRARMHISHFIDNYKNIKEVE